MEQTYTPKQDYKVLVRCFTYNQSKYIEDALNGFAMQKTDFPFVCLVVDDCSTDGEQDVIKAWLERECDMSKVEYVELELANVILIPHRTNESCNIAIYLLKKNLWKEAGLKRALVEPWQKHSEYEAICEGDDYWIVEDKLQKQVSFLDNNKDYVLCHTSYKSFFQKENIFVLSRDVINNKQYPSIYTYNILDKYILMTLTVLYRTEIQRKAKEMDPFLFSGYFMMGDTNLWYQMARIGKIKFIEDVTSVYRRNEGSVSRPGDAKKAYRFILSSNEMRYYLCKRDNLRDDVTVKYKKLFNRAVLFYWCFDPSYKSKLFEVKTPDPIIKVLIKSGILKRILAIKYAIRTYGATLYRKLIRPKYSFG